MEYEIEVDFHPDVSDVITSHNYHKVLDEYNARGIGHDKTQTSTMFLSSKQPLDLAKLTQDLGNIKILSVKEVPRQENRKT